MQNIIAQRAIRTNLREFEAQRNRREDLAVRKQEKGIAASGSDKDDALEHYGDPTIDMLVKSLSWLQ